MADVTPMTPQAPSDNQVVVAGGMIIPAAAVVDVPVAPFVAPVAVPSVDVPVVPAAPVVAPVAVK